MAEIPILRKDDLDAEQRALWDQLTLGPRGFYTGGADAKRLPDLYNAWLQFPVFGRLMLGLVARDPNEDRQIAANWAAAGLHYFGLPYHVPS